MKKETRQQRYRRKLTEANLKRIEVYIDKDDVKAEKAIRAYDKRGEVEK